MTESREVEDLARQFLMAAGDVLRGEHVLPTPRYHPYLHVGRDYFGSSIASIGEFARFEQAIVNRHQRFAEATPLMERDFASNYIFSLLEAFIAETTRNAEDWSLDAPSLQKCLDSLVSAVDVDESEVACCREVSNMTTAGQYSLELAGVTVVPLTELPSEHRASAIRAIEDVIPHASGSYGGDDPGRWEPPHVIVISRGSSKNPFDKVHELSSQIDSFLFVARLLHAGTCSSLYEVQGNTALVRRFTPTLVRPRDHAGLLASPRTVQRVTRLDSGDVRRFSGICRAVEAVQGEAQTPLTNSFGVAKHRFQTSYHARSWPQEFIDLSIALEATLSGFDISDVALRLKNRAAALLATDDDSAGAIFNDIGHLYKIRSQLIHGSALSERGLNKSVSSITTVPDDGLAGVAVAHAVERLRDIVRRSLLARICLASCDPPLWEFGEDKGVDAQLADASTRSQWHSAWHEFLDRIGAGASAERPKNPTFLGREEE